MEGNYTTAVYSTDEAVNAVWILASSGFIMLIPIGLALIEAGAVRRKNRSAALIKNLWNGSLAAIVFWLFGYGLGFGSPTYFVGHDGNYFASEGFELIPEDNYLYWDIQFAYCMVVIAIY